MIPWLTRLAQIGATNAEVASITAAYEASPSNVQAALDQLIAGIANSDLLVMLTNWRQNAGIFGAGFPGGGLPFGAHAPLLTGNPADDAAAISAGTGIKLSSFVNAAGTVSGDIPVSNGQGGYVWETLPTGGPALDSVAADIQMDGQRSAGTVGKAADAGHTHPTDTSRAAVAALLAGLGNPEPTITASANLTANSWQLIAGTGNAPLIATLPSASANLGQIILVEREDDGTAAGAQTVQVKGTIRGVPNTALSLTLLDQALVLVGEGSGSWRPIAGHHPLAALLAYIDANASLPATSIGYNDALTGIGVGDAQDAIAAAYELASSNAASIATVTQFLASTAVGWSGWQPGTGWSSVRPAVGLCIFVGPGAEKGAYAPSTPYNPWDIVNQNGNTYAWVGSGGPSNPTEGTSGSSFTAANWQQVPAQTPPDFFVTALS